MFFYKNSKYDIKPEDNHPAKIYGVYLPEDNYDVNNQEQNIKPERRKRQWKKRHRTQR